MKKRCTIFVISDFMAEGFDQSLRMLGRKHDVVAMVVRDQFERELPHLGVVDLQDAESGQVMTVDTSSPEFRMFFSREVKKRNEDRDRLLRQSQVDRVDVDSSGSFVDPLIEYFRRRKARSR